MWPQHLTHAGLGTSRPVMPAMSSATRGWGCTVCAWRAARAHLRSCTCCSSALLGAQDPPAAPMHAGARVLKAGGVGSCESPCSDFCSGWFVCAHAQKQLSSGPWKQCLMISVGECQVSYFENPTRIALLAHSVSSSAGREKSGGESFLKTGVKMSDGGRSIQA